jgi:hypothetical protein
MMNMTMVTMSSRFEGPEVTTGRVLAKRDGTGLVLSLSDDFVVPNAPAPHWQVVDASGNAYLLQRLMVADGRTNRTITVPAYVRQVARVRIYCAFAEVVLGEVSFPSPVM